MAEVKYLTVKDIEEINKEMVKTYGKKDSGLKKPKNG